MGGRRLKPSSSHEVQPAEIVGMVRQGGDEKLGAVAGFGWFNNV